MKKTKSFQLGLIIIAITISSFFVAFTTDDDAKHSSWPRKIESDKGTVIIYQPQVEKFSGNILEARAAVSVKTTENPESVFGAMWFECTVSTNRDTRKVHLLKVKVTAAKFPDMEDDNVKKLSAFLEKEIPEWNMEMSLDDLLASLEVNEDELKMSKDLNNEAPEIIFSITPAVLIFIDGEPKLKDTDDSNYQTVINTPFFIAKDKKRNEYYLKGGEYWFVSNEILTGWKNTEKPPKKLVKIADEAMGEAEDTERDIEKTGETKKVIPQIFVRTKPTELLQSDGEPEFSPIEGTSLLYVSNTENDILMDINSQQYYILVSGRWYTSGSMTTDKWTFIEPDKVPVDFAKIPSGSEMGTVKASVAGTQEAKEAVLENQIPQTAEVDRSEAKLEVKYDGKPQFEKIEGTNMKYAVNTDKSVLLISKKYYCCDDAIWFESDNAVGPWTVSTKVPGDVQNIPPGSPVYNVKYVYIYDVTPTVVYVGYTPGYVNSYVYGGCVYYGTGYYYNPWYGAYYYPRPVTYGFGVHYNPYSGWGFSFGMSVGGPYGWMTYGYHRHSYGYWGPAGYRHGYHHGYRHGYHAGARAGYNAGRRNSASNNVYNNRANGVTRTGGANYNPKTGGRTPATSDRAANKRTTQPANRANNVYTDRSGNVYKKDGNNWQSRQGGQWQDASKSTGSRPQTRETGQATPATRDKSQTQSRDVNRNVQPSRSNQSTSRSTSQQQRNNLNNAASSRNRGTQRTQNYNQNRQSHQYQRPSSTRSAGTRSTGARPSGGRAGGRR